MNTKMKDYLSQAFRLDQRISSKLDQLAALRGLATKATASLPTEDVGNSIQNGPGEKAIGKIHELENEIEADIDRLVNLKHEIIGVINSVEQPEYHLVLELRYLSFLPWEAIAERMNYSYRQIHRVHGQALDSIEGGTP